MPPSLPAGGTIVTIRLGTGVIQLAARTPANAAMSFGTVDALAGGSSEAATIDLGRRQPFYA